MIDSSLLAISPIDGRYQEKTVSLNKYFSEYALIKYRVLVEIEYLIELSSKTNVISEAQKEIISSKAESLKSIYQDFSLQDARQVKKIEEVTNHDVKAVEYFIKEKLDSLQLSDIKEFVHFGLTSQDINNTAIPLSLKDGLETDVIPLIEKLLGNLILLSDTWKDIPMLAKTHGQAASPTTLGKEISVFAVRLQKQLEVLTSLSYCGKFGGATGNFNAHYFCYPNTDWHLFAQNFLLRLGLERNYPTTQIAHYDDLSNVFDCLKRINVIFLDFAKDVWQYISMGYFSQKTVLGEVGSSAMPHKVNPIDFENAEGNLTYANAILNYLSDKLPISRLQRDLTDSTVLRNIGVPLGHSVIAYQSLLKGLNKIEVNQKIISKDLEANWIVVVEGIQTLLRTINYPNPYETLKEFSRGKSELSKEDIDIFIQSLSVNEEIKKKLLALTPFNYIGK